MLKHAATLSPSDEIILKGILEGFGSVLDLNKIDKINSEIKKIFQSIKEDSGDLPEGSLYQVAYYMAKNRAQVLAVKKDKAEQKAEPKAEPKPETFVQPIIKRKRQEAVTTAPTSSEPIQPESIQPIIEPQKEESKSSVIRRAIFDAFDFVGGLNEATTIEHINHEAKKVYEWFINKIDKLSSYDLYEAAFRAAKNRAEEIIAAHNILVDQELKSQMKIKRKEDSERDEIERQRISEVAKIELEELINKLLHEKDLSLVTKEALKYFKLIYLDDKRDPEVVHLFPGTSRDQRYQWKARAVRMIAPYASEDARKYIGEKTKRKFAYAPNILIKAAQIFLIRCQEG